MGGGGTMSWFGRTKMSDEAGQWSAMAMACMVFADGAAAEAEIAAAHGQVTTNPVLHESIGSGEAERLFKETVDAIAQIPAAMLPTYEIRLAGLAQQITEINDKNFALTTVIAVSMSDRTLSASEHQMLMRFHKMLGASIPIPEPGAAATGEVKQLQAVTPTGATGGCATCGKPTQFYQGRGVWCASCQRWMGGPEATPAQAGAQQASAQQANASQAAAQATSTPPASAPQATAPQAATPQASAQQTQPSSLGHCPNCGTKLVPYQGYGPYCSTCRQVIQL
jgi:uncharacterized Zn finger protein (UPF0148 family)